MYFFHLFLLRSGLARALPGTALCVYDVFKSHERITRIEPIRVRQSEPGQMQRRRGRDENVKANQTNLIDYSGPVGRGVCQDVISGSQHTSGRGLERIAGGCEARRLAFPGIRAGAGLGREPAPCEARGAQVA